MPTYNDKKFLLPNSINSCSLYHAKIEENGEYRFRIHDCIGAIRLHGDLNTEEGRNEAFEKLNVLITGLKDFQDFIYQNFMQTKIIYQ